MKKLITILLLYASVCYGQSMPLLQDGRWLGLYVAPVSSLPNPLYKWTGTTNIDNNLVDDISGIIATNTACTLNGDYVAMNGSTSKLMTQTNLLTTQTNVTISLWCVPSAINPYNRGLFEFWDVAANVSIWSLFAYNGNYYFRTISLDILTAAYGTIPSTSAWTHVCGTYNQSAGKCEVYVNGIIGTTASGTRPTTGWNAGKYKISIGTHTMGQSILDKWVDDIRVYTNSLSSNEVFTLYGEGRK